jgi:hypothetical protein
MKNLNKNLPYILAGIIFVVIIFCLIYIFSRPQKASTPNISSPTPTLTPTPIFEQKEPEGDFGKVVLQLKTPQQLIEYLNKEFTLLEEEKEKFLLPKDFFEQKQGSAFDFSIFASYVLWYNKYEVAILHYKFEKDQKIQKNAVLVFYDETEKVPKTMIFTKEGAKTYLHGRSFVQALEKEQERLGAKIKEYSVCYWSDKGELKLGGWKEFK